MKKLISAALVCTWACAQTGILGIKDIHAGQKGVGRTVFSGTKVEEFQVEVLGVLENIGPKQNLILGRLSGGPLEKTGVMQGMSGSPVWVDGKLIGAVALAFPFSKEPIAGIRPIEEMLAQRAVPAASGQARAEVKFGENRLMEVATPVSFSGFTSRAVEHFAGDWRKLGLEPLQGVGGQSTKAATPAKLEPGSMISVQLVTGDMGVAADGTVTHIDGQRVYAFGHRFLSLGSAELPFARSEVIALLPNLASSFKISNGHEPLGVITSDGNAAIAGVLGKRAPMIPVKVDVGGTRPSSYKVEMVQNSTLTPFLTQMVLFSALDSTERSLGASTVRIRGTVQFEDGLPPLKLEQVYAGDFNAPVVAAIATAAPLSYLTNSTLEPVRIKSAEFTISAAEARKVWQIDQVTASRREARPGDELELAVIFTGEGDRQEVRKLKYQVPPGAPTGTLFITAGDGTSTNLAESRSLLASPTRPARQMIPLLNAMRANSSAYVRLWRADTTYSLGGVDAPNLPAGLSMMLARNQTQPIVLGGGGSKLGEMEIALGDVVVAGTKTIQLEIKD